jgi:hypothetical protein
MFLFFAALALWLALSAFSDGSGLYSLTVDPSFKFDHKNSAPPIGTVYAFIRPSRDGQLLVMSDNAKELDGYPSLHNALVAMVTRSGDRVTEEKPYTVAGRSCLYAAGRDASQKIVTVSRYMLCFVPTTRQDVPIAALVINIEIAESDAAKFDSVFWQAVGSLRWGPLVR